ncbi:MAG: glycosyltransferase family 4 protein [Candidatus Roizmanbacteria bacterium]|nr:MAG: glycosyltransferase family 4 protein [Candidatus Roizmanbacteria bacterium]
MKILYLYMFPLWGNGSGAWLTRLVHKLKLLYEQDFEAAIIAPDHRTLDDAKIFRAIPPFTGVFVGNPELPNAKRYMDISNSQHLFIYNYYLQLTTKSIEKFKPDLIHAFHTAFLPPLARQISDFYKIPFIISTHGSDLYYFKEDYRWRSQVKDASIRAKFIIANSNFTRNWYLQMFGRDLYRKMKTIPAGIDNNIDFSKDVSWIDEKYHFTFQKMVLFTGRLTKHKGVDYLIKAARQIKAEIVILGDGPERGYLEKLIKQCNLQNVHMLGYFSQRLGAINDFYLRADVYVAPSVWDEPLGLVILEAMAYKTPVIVTRKGGVTTIVKDGLNGLLVRPRSANIIAQQVNYLLKNDKIRLKMSENAYKTVLNKFSWEKIAAKFYHLYQKSTNLKNITIITFITIITVIR